MRSCEEFERLLPAYVAGVADQADVADIGEHLAECSPCMNDFQRVVKDLGALKAWRDPVVPEGLSARVLERLVASEDLRRREALGEETAWGAPLQRGLTWAVLSVLTLVVLATMVTAQTAARHDSKRRACANNLHNMAAAIPGDQFLPPLKSRLEALHLRKALDEETRTCPLGDRIAPGQFSNYLLELHGPRFLAGDDPRNHGYSDANVLLNDGTVITITPAQAGLWELLDPYSPGR